MQLVEVGENPAYQKEFIQLPVRLYRNNPCWIRPLDKDIEDVFDPVKNKYFQQGECIRWLLINDQKQTIGRIAAFIDRNTATRNNDQPTGGMGFFECIEDQTAAFQLFDAAKAWLQSKGMEAMDGPINFGERDRWWGLLANGFDKEPTYGMPYTQPYYVPFFENYGFQEYFRQFTYLLPMREDRVRHLLHPSVFERSMRALNDPTYDFRHITKAELSKYADDFRYIYNKAWARHLSVGEMSEEQSRRLMQRMKPILDEELIWFGYHKEEPIAFFITLPELNQIFKHVNGKLNLIGKLKFLYHKLMKTNKKAFGVIFGIIPEYQGRGIESAIALAFTRVAWRPNYQYEELELNWVGDFNPKMIRFAKMLGGVVNKEHITYRYLFDRTKEFKRHPTI
ncbi:hypothetical protein LX87_02756 [Larkinella arboricola]|uniref:N-acetyltransferase domain-containing protein n=1 Tax=Larkinella arboricola TaxID=643671 RepID=A0A327WZ72_LARAB|nr:hypothetical protein [Larkinella arboricola]RAJ97850.1 hypothetical protein LX87_02756 [Larkinella arboricola]